MNRYFSPPRNWGYYIVALIFLFVTCQKGNDFSSKQNNAVKSDESVAASQDEYAYYYSAADKKLYLTQTYEALCKADLYAEVVTATKWIIGFPGKTERPEVQIILMKGQTFHYTRSPNLGDTRTRQSFLCTGNKAKVNTCTDTLSGSVKTASIAYTFCEHTQNQQDLCTEEYKAVGYGIIYKKPGCTGRARSSAVFYDWVCM